jgi:hypothetical protein
LKKPEKKEKRPTNCSSHWKINRFNVRKILMEKYVDPGSPIVKIHINNIPIANTLIDLGVAINVMTKGTMEELKLFNLRHTPTIFAISK